MAPVMSGQDVYEIAIGMEQIAEEFYRALAAGSGDPKVQRFCRRVTAEEGRHLALFRALQRSVSGPETTRRPPTRHLSDLTRAAKASIQPDPAFVRKVAMGHDPKNALEMAVRMEENAISYYQGLLTAMPGSEAVLLRITTEEQKHLTALHALAGRLLL